MADTSIDPLLKELQITNGLTRELLREKREDDTPKSLFMGNMFEIFNARILQTSQRKFEKTEGVYKVDNILSDSVSAIGDTNTHLDEVNQTLQLGFDGVANLLGMLALRRDDVLIFGQFVTEAIEPSIDALGNDIKQLPNNFVGPLLDANATSASKEKEAKKDELVFLRNLFGSVTGGIKGFGKNIMDGFKGLKDSLLGKAGLATALLALGAFLVSKFPALAEAVGNVTMGFVNLFQDTGKLFSGEMGFGEYLRDNFLTFIGLGLFAFKTAIITFFKTKLVAFVTTKFAAILLAAKGGLTAAIMPVLGAISLFFLKFVAIPYAIFKGIMGFFEGYSKRLSEGGGFFTSLIAGLQGAIGGVFEAIGNILDLIVGFVFDMFGGAEFYEEYIAKPIRDTFAYLKDLFTIDFDSIGDSISSFFSGDPEGKYMGGAVASGTPYIVGEKGPELFVPGASGSIIPNGGMGGGAPIIVTNNNVSAPTNTHSHQHSNVSITDNQQEITGL